jgi:hypothetical protein
MKNHHSTTAFLLATLLLLVLNFETVAASRPSVEAAKRRRMGLTSQVVNRRIVNSSSSSVVSSSSSSSVAPSVFVAFLKRYIYLPDTSWSGRVDKATNTATFTQGGSSFTISLFNWSDCNTEGLQKIVAASWKAVNKPVQETVTVAKARGAVGSGFTWLEPGANGTVRKYCMVPEGHIYTSVLTTLETDAVSKKLIEDQILAQIFRSDRKGQGR